MARLPLEVREQVEKELEKLGAELVDIEFKREPIGRVLRIFVDQPGGVDLDACERISQKLSVVLDELNLIKESYFLEVSSPGLERRLTKPEHFQRFVGSKIKVQLREKINGRKKFSGRLEKANESGIIIVDEQQKFSFRYDQIEKANLVFEFK